MRKIPPEIEHPIDNLIIDAVDYLSEPFHKMGFTANGVTTLSLLTGLLSVNLFCRGNHELAAFMFLVSYFFDCMDGFYARKYDQVTDFGDYYDHAKDLLIVVIFVYCIWNKIEKIETKVIALGIFFILFFLMHAHMGCQQKIYKIYEIDKEDIGNSSLEMSEKLCPVSEEKSLYDTMKISKWFGCATVNLYAAFIIYYSKFL